MNQENAVQTGGEMPLRKTNDTASAMCVAKRLSDKSQAAI
jgi:hypothetical protein